MASFSGIKNTLLAEQVEEQLYEYITKLPMKAGDKLSNEFKLAEMFGVGRSIALIMDGRFSGASTGPVIGHCSPEA